MASAGARAYKGGLGAQPPAGSRGRAPGRGSGGKDPLKLKSFLRVDVHWKRKICPYSPCIADSVSHVFNPTLTVGDRPGGHLGLRSRLDLAPKRLEKSTKSPPHDST